MTNQGFVSANTVRGSYVSWCSVVVQFSSACRFQTIASPGRYGLDISELIDMRRGGSRCDLLMPYNITKSSSQVCSLIVIFADHSLGVASLKMVEEV